MFVLTIQAFRFQSSNKKLSLKKIVKENQITNFEQNKDKNFEIIGFKRNRLIKD